MADQLINQKSKKRVLILVGLLLLILLILFYRQSANTKQKKLSSPRATTTNTVQVTKLPEATTSLGLLVNKGTKSPIINQQTENCTELSQEAFAHYNHLFDNFLNNKDTIEARQMAAISNHKAHAYQSLIKKTNPNNFDEDKFKAIKIAELVHLMNELPDNKLAGYHYLIACSEKLEHPSCLQQSIDKAISNDSNNAALWSIIAGIYLQQEKFDDALAALEKAATTPLYDDYQQQRYRLFNDTLSQFNQFPTSGVSMVTTVGYVAAIASSNIYHIFKYCKQFANTRDDIAQSCLNYGKRLEKDEYSMLSVQLGLSLQQVIYEAKHNEEEVSNIIIIKIQTSQRYNDLLIFKHSNSLFSHNEDYQRYALTTLMNYNEIDAWKIIKQEGLRITSQPDFIPCPD